MIKHPKRFKESNPAGYDGLFDWDFLRPAFNGTKIEPMDIDAVVERHGYFLVFETKKPDKEIPQGQAITLESLVLLGRGRVLVLVLYGKNPEEIEGMEQWAYSGGKVIKIHKPCNADDVLNKVTAWFNFANNNWAT